MQPPARSIPSRPCAPCRNRCVQFSIGRSPAKPMPGSTIAVTLQYGPLSVSDGKTVTFILTAPLASATTYKVYIYYCYITDVAGNRLITTNSSTFTTQ